MTTQKLYTHNYYYYYYYYSLLQVTTLNLSTYGCRLKVTLCLLLLLFFFFSSAFTAAERTNPPSPPAAFVSVGKSFNPAMAILMVVLVGAFFILGFFAIYIRQCIERRYRRIHGAAGEAAGGEGGGPPWSRRSPVGLDASVIETFPTFLYSSVKALKIGKRSLECAVCLNEFQEDETLRLIPKCSHVFHPDCIDAWLSSHITCPVCRANLVPKPDDDSPSCSVRFFETGDHFEPVEPQSHVRDCENQNQNPVQVFIDGVDPQIRRNPPEMQSLEANLLYPVHQNPSIRSWSSTRWRFPGMLFPRSHSTGHSLVQPGENTERFTLRLPEDVRNQIINMAQLNRSKSNVMFTRARSSRQGYRSASVGSQRRKNYFNYEQLEPNRDYRSNHPGFPFTSLSVSEAVLVQSGKENKFGIVEDQVSATPTVDESLGLNHVNEKKDDQNDEGSSDWPSHTSQI